MDRIKTTMRRLPNFIPEPDQRIGNKNIRGERNATFKTKELLTQTKVMEV